MDGEIAMNMGQSNIDASANNWGRLRVLYLLACAALLSIPAIAMQFTSEVAWGPGDFLVMGALLLALGAGAELALRTARSRTGMIVGIALATVLFLAVWAELAVGIFD